MMPNIPGISALLESLNALITADQPVYPKKGNHTPVTQCATVFGHHRFPIHNERTDFQKWCLVSSGLQYHCEADEKLNKALAERYEHFDFPVSVADDNPRKLPEFLGLDKSMAWFSQVKEVGTITSTFFKESGTLANCAPTGFVANQVMVVMRVPEFAPSPPTHSADKRSLFEFCYQLNTTARNLPLLAQTHTCLFASHPYYGMFRMKESRLRAILGD